MGGITFHLNRLDLWAKPSDRGAEIFNIRPSNDFVTIVNQTKKSKGKDDGLWIQREDASNTFTIHGECKKTLEELLQRFFTFAVNGECVGSVFALNPKSIVLAFGFLGLIHNGDKVVAGANVENLRATIRGFCP